MKKSCWRIGSRKKKIFGQAEKEEEEKWKERRKLWSLNQSLALSKGMSIVGGSVRCCNLNDFIITRPYVCKYTMRTLRYGALATSFG